MPAAGAAVRAEVVEALTGLGFPLKQAEQAVEKVLAGTGSAGAADTASVLRAALTTLGRKS
jgi:Holliday junction DNA helicase RuvA